MTITVTLPELVLAQARSTPDADAIVQWEHRLTYRELVGAAELLAARLSAAGVGPEVRVGICATRGIGLPVAVLGIMLAGGAYVPLDPNHPRRRLDTILADAQISVVVVDVTGRELLAGTGRRLLDIPLGAPAWPIPQWTNQVRPDNTAYVLYTSGSTGVPKGVVVSHRNVTAFGAAAALHRPLNGGRSAGFASLGFDTSVFDLLLPLARGASVALVPDADRVDPVRLQRFLREHRVTSAMLPPAVLPLLDPDQLPDLADLFSAGEPCGPEQVRRWSAPPGKRFHNWYGPTETTVIVVGGELTGTWDRPLPIGTPLPGCDAYVLDERLRLCPPGVAGELCIGGPQLARGYHGRPAQTAAAFVPDPFGPVPGARLYRTGDLVRLEPDGTIAYLGRLDRQVKIQGQRVEIGEVETVVRAHPRVHHAVVDVAERGGVKHLVAYLTPADAPDVAELREHCLRRMPGYMAPTEVVRLPELPLNLSGKVDLAALRHRTPPYRASIPAPEPSPAGGVLATVTATWARVFESAPPAPDTEFIGAGGHSLLAMRLIAALRPGTGREISIEDVYRGGTVAGLAERVAAAPPLADDAVPTASASALSAAQRQMWFVEQLTPGTAAHNIALAERLHGPLDVTALRAALAALADRQEALRWRMPQTGGVPRVVVDPPGDLPFEYTDLSTPGGPGVEELLDATARTPFDLAAGPLWRARLVRLSPDEHILAVTVHHIVFDGWSWGVLYRDLARAYRQATGEGGPDAEPPAGFADYVAWLERRTDAADRDRTWWTAHLTGAPLVLDLPRDRSRPPVQTFRGADAQARLRPETVDQVRALAAAFGATPFAVLLAAFGQQLRRLTGQRDLIVGTPLADRRHAAFERTIGCFVQIMPLRLTVRDDEGFAGHVQRCRDEVAAALAHPDLALDRLVQAGGGARDLSRNPVVQVLFNMYGFTGHRLELPGLDAQPITPVLPGSLFDLTLYVDEDATGYALRAAYNPDLYDPARIEALLAGYVHLLEQLCADPDRSVGVATSRPPGSDLPGWQRLAAPWHGAGLVERVRDRAAARPDAVVAEGAGGRMTYRELLARAAGTAGVVRAAGVSAGQTVAVLAARDVRLPAVLLGVLATGARWLVLDAALPPAARERQLRAAAPHLLIDVADTPARLDGELYEVAARGRGYLSLTSGTTGEPALVAAPERPLAHFLHWYPTTFGIGAGDRFALLAGLGHDPALRDVFTPLVLGARLCVPEQQLLRDPARLLSWLSQQRVTVAHLTPQLARLVADAAPAAAALPELRLVVFAGDQLRHGDVAALRRLAPGARVANMYGATETPQGQAWHEVPPGPGAGDDHPVPIGQGIDGARLLVLDRNGAPAGAGELGEVVIRSRYLAVEPADRFGTPPDPDSDDDRLYPTGDLGRFRPDGTVVLAGRSDDQVKIRGYRVELGEVESVLAAHPGVARAAVITAVDGGERTLRAFVVPARTRVRTGELLAHVRAHLGDHATPADVALLPELPLTANGKVDRAALAAVTPHRGGLGTAEDAATATERLIADIWRTVLVRPTLAATDNFFEAGGHSMAAVAAAARLGHALGREVPVIDLFRCPTVRTLAAHLDGGSDKGQLDRGVQRGMERRRRARRTPSADLRGATS